MNANMSRTAVTGYDPALKFYATKYKQGGRTVFSMDLSLAQVSALIPAPDPTRPAPGNRSIRPAHAQSFANYIRGRADWIAPSLVLRGPNMFDFDAIETIEGTEFGIIAFPRLAMTDLHILDGQHRVLGIHMALKGIADDLDRVRSALASARKSDAMETVIDNLKRQIERLAAQRKRFDTERVAIQIFVEEEQYAYQQMFYDITENALGITASVKVRFDTTRIANRVLRTVLLHPLLTGRVDLEHDRLGRINPNLLSAKHVAEIVRIMVVGQDGRITKRLEDELDENTMVLVTNSFLDVMHTAFPQLQQVADGELAPAQLRQRSMLGSPVTIRVLAAVYAALVSDGVEPERVAGYFRDLDTFLSATATKAWVKAVGGDLFMEGGLAPSSRRQDLKAYKDKLVLWAMEGLPSELEVPAAPAKAPTKRSRSYTRKVPSVKSSSAA